MCIKCEKYREYMYRLLLQTIAIVYCAVYRVTHLLVD